MPTLNWLGKKHVVNHHKTVPFHLLRCDESLSYGNADSGNLLVQGDNLLALKALLPHYAGQVKCIYIDPPYNTGNENWVYNDNVNSPEIKNWLTKTVGKEGEDLSRHDKWLCMMYPRLALLKEFLREDGFVFISLDDNEIAPLKLICEEIFDAKNFVAQIIVESNRRGQTYKQISKNHEYILCYSRSGKAVLNEIETEGERLDKHDEWGAYSARELRNRNPKFNRTNRPNLFYPIYIDPQPSISGHHKILQEKTADAIETVPLNSTEKESCWRWGQPKLIESAGLGLKEIYASQTKNGDWRVFEKYRKETITPKSLWTETEFISEQGTSLLRKLGFGELFEFPKPVALIERIIKISTSPGDLVLDSFCGSGTTGHAVWGLDENAVSKRTFILIEMDEHIAQNVAAKRLEKVGAAFRFCKLADGFLASDGSVNKAVRFADMAAHVFFTETGSPLPKQPKSKSPFLGGYQGRGIYLLYNGILGDKSVNGGNVLTHSVAGDLPLFDGVKIVYGEACRLQKKALERYNIVFRHIPYEIKGM
ncbi:MAG: site-specific DNA-methyltransferase [Planctomycetaceae bacterium]|jgi:adenine-specific DNA-methyltransferase|nr:site-specific DNA-methyltransferase [Planctomycetaceae bacterium]